MADDCDLEIELERGELADLLDRAMAVLPAGTRAALIERYVRDSSHADVAARLGVSEEAVKKKVERGKIALKRVLSTELRAEALSYGLISPQADRWQETRVWCPGCGRRRLEGRLRPDSGELYMRCPACSLPHTTHYIASQLGDTLRGLRTFKPALSRVLGTIHDLYHVRPVDGAVRCATCGDRRPVQRGLPPHPPSGWDPGPGCETLYLWCHRCGYCDVETWHALTWSLPEARQFWQEHPRMRFLPEREIEAAGSPAIVTGFESLAGGARLEVVALRDTCRVVSIARDGVPCP